MTAGGGRRWPVGGRMTAGGGRRWPSRPLGSLQARAPGPWARSRPALQARAPGPWARVGRSGWSVGVGRSGVAGRVGLVGRLGSVGLGWPVGSVWLVGWGRSVWVGRSVAGRWRKGPEGVALVTEQKRQSGVAEWPELAVLGGFEALRESVGCESAGFGGVIMSRAVRGRRSCWGWCEPWATRRRTWRRLLVPSIRPLEGRPALCQAKISSPQAMMVSTT